MRYRGIKISLLLVFLSFSGCAYYNTFYNAKKFYREAEKEREKRERTQVVELSPEEKARMKKSGVSSEDQLNRPTATEMTNYQKSIEKSSRVLEFYPTSKYVDDALFLLGECFYYRREFKKAERKFNELMSLYPTSELIPETRLYMAKTYLGLREYEEAERRFREIVYNDEYKNRIKEEAGYELGGLYFEQENFEMAAENYGDVAKSSSDKLIKALSLYRLGVCLINLKQFEEAPDAFRRAVRQSPNDDFKAQATFKLGESQSLLGDYKAAIKTFSDLLSKDFDAKREPRIKLQLANNLNLSGDLDEAIKWYEDIIERHKRTDASARSYYALAEIEEFTNIDYKKAKENYDLVRAEFANSLIAPDAINRANDIGALLDLRNEIARLEGRAVVVDSTAGGDGAGDAADFSKDDGPIDLPGDGMWINYAGRDRPPPVSLTDLTESDKQRAALLQARQLEAATTTDSLGTAQVPTVAVELDSAALALQKEKEEEQKKIQLVEKHLALAQLLLFSFDKVDSSVFYFQHVLDSRLDSSFAAQALYSMAYIQRVFKKDTLLADSMLKDLIDLYPESPQAEGARSLLGMELTDVEVDSARIIFREAENSYNVNRDLEQALELYQQVCERYPDSPFAPKAMYAKGWHYENTLSDTGLAIDHYRLIADRYPESPYTLSLKPKLSVVDAEWKKIRDRNKAIADSIAQATKTDSLPQDSTATAPGDSTKPAITDSAAALQPNIASPSAGQTEEVSLPDNRAAGATALSPVQQPPAGTQGQPPAQPDPQSPPAEPQGQQSPPDAGTPQPVPEKQESDKSANPAPAEEAVQQPDPQSPPAEPQGQQSPPDSGSPQPVPEKQESDKSANPAPAEEAVQQPDPQSPPAEPQGQQSPPDSGSPQPVPEKQESDKSANPAPAEEAVQQPDPQSPPAEPQGQQSPPDSGSPQPVPEKQESDKSANPAPG